MPSLEYEVVQYVTFMDSQDLSYRTFVETGTWLGHTIFRMENHFDELHTIEISEKFYRDAKNKYTGDKISFHLGDTSEVLKDIVPKLSNNTFFFLDAHYSGGDTGRGDKDCPLIEEIEIIHSSFKPSAIIIIDDFRLFGTNSFEDWSQISKQKILNIVKDRMKTEYHCPSDIDEKDRWVIHMSEQRKVESNGVA